MKIALIGATGYVGSKILAEALERRHQVTGIARHTETLPLHSQLTRKNGDVFDAEGLTRLLAGHDAVISSVQFRMSDPRILIHAVKTAKVQRYLVVGGVGSLETKPGVMLVDDPEFPPSAKPLHADPLAEARAGYEFLKLLRAEPALNWTFLSPSGTPKPGSRTGRFRLGKDQLLMNGNGKPAGISQEDFAIAMLDELEKPQHPRQRFTVGY